MANLVSIFGLCHSVYRLLSHCLAHQVKAGLSGFLGITLRYPVLSLIPAPIIFHLML
jgi:hypothetical protein